MMGCCAKDAIISHAQSGQANSEAMAAVFAALSNSARIDILRHIARHRDCGCKEITDTLPLAQSTVSQHLKVLIEAGLIRIETVHPRSRYQVDEELLKDLRVITGEFLNSCCNGKNC